MHPSAFPAICPKWALFGVAYGIHLIRTAKKDEYRGNSSKSNSRQIENSNKENAISQHKRRENEAKETNESPKIFHILLRIFMRGESNDIFQGIESYFSRKVMLFLSIPSFFKKIKIIDFSHQMFVTRGTMYSSMCLHLSDEIVFSGLNFAQA